ncbi:NAD(+)/NADH kinase [candidate division KSB1 bacterium]|nr:NAD(+)/NADH kinase [candidate division KSB1 bacterium]
MILGLTGNIDKASVKPLVTKFVKWLQKSGADFIVENELAEYLSLPKESCPRSSLKNFFEKCQMVISFGGDGTILSTARAIGDSGVPILGVKMGGMGFLAELTPEELYASMEEILKGHYQIVKRMVLQVEVEGEKTTRYHALNDLVFDKGAVSRVIHIKTFIDDEFLNTYISDGLIISTPTGSTAYSLAAGGPILLPSMNAIIINPISPHTLGARPVVIPDDKVVKIRIEYAPQNVLLSADGQVSKELKQGQTATIQKADYQIKLVSYRGRSFYDVLRAKLNWGEDIRES